MWSGFLSWHGWTFVALPTDGGDAAQVHGQPPAQLLETMVAQNVWEILFCREGSLWLELPQGRRLEVDACQALVLPGLDAPCRYHFSQTPFQGILVRGGLSWGTPPCQGPAVLGFSLWCQAMFHVLDHLPREHQGTYCTVKARELCYLLCVGTPRLFRTASGSYYDQHQLQTVHLVHDYLINHLDEPLTIRQLSAQFHISATVLKSCFRQRYGAPLHQYLREHRMARAAELLVSTEQSVLQIALAVGYGSPSQFGAAFKAHYQMTPSQFRRQQKMSISDCSRPDQIESSK